MAPSDNGPLRTRVYGATPMHYSFQGLLDTSQVDIRLSRSWHLATIFIITITGRVHVLHVQSLSHNKEMCYCLL